MRDEFGLRMVGLLCVTKRVRLWGLAVAAAICFASIAAAGSDGATTRAVLAQTPLVGGVTDTSAVLVVRTSKPATVVVHYGIGLLDAVTAPVVTRSGDDDAAHIALEGLLPETTYSYAVEINNVLDAGVLSFTTFPSPTQERSFTFVAFADQDTPRPAPAYVAGAAASPAFVVQLGDFTHSAVGPTGRKLKVADWWRLNLRSTASTPAGSSFASAIAGSFPFVHIWDDHDYGDSDGDRTFKYRSLAMQAFRDDFPTYPLSSPSRGFWQRFSYAQAEVFVLDLRSARDPDKRPDDGTKSMLGATQKAWLLNGLSTSTATWKFIVSSSVWNPHSKQVDSWALYKHEQNEIVDFIRTNSITGVIFMSGDIHSAGAIDDGTNSYFPEISVPNTNTQSTTCTGHSGCGTWSEGYTVGAEYDGYAEFHVTADSVTLEAKGANGEIRHSLTVVKS
jgi:alkaline phosphatase D